jgi:two-component system, NtrC family, response regulator AtoC
MQTAGTTAHARPHLRGKWPRQKADRSAAPAANRHEPPKLVGTSPRMQQIYEQIARVAPTQAPVFILGDSGTGKELVARAIHELSTQRQGPFVAVNCSTLSPAMSGNDLVGLDQEATLFLDAVTEMPMELQGKMLRFLECETGFVRVIAATNRQPELAIRQGRFRDDLYYRLNVFHISLPSLAERIEDVPPLAEHFLEQIAAASGGRQKRFTAETMKALMAYAWPGNVRELRNVVQSASIMATGAITVDCLPAEMQTSPAEVTENAGAISIPIGVTAAEAERRLIVATLAHFEDCKWKAAETLGISLKTLYNRLHKYGESESPLGDPVFP